jgi:hypothetical protein
MQAIVSAFMFAIITDRALLIDWKSTKPIEHFNKEEIVAMEALNNFFEVIKSYQLS